jgi:16S rRNA (guanine966-N2)-methyltransferase
MRINAGKYKGRTLEYPRSGLRPTKDMTRQAIFNVIGRSIKSSKVCDLYAGGGALGIEALSRGASEVVFVEQNPAIVRFLRMNAKGLDGTTVIKADVLKALPKLAGSGFDIVLADPPYCNRFVQPTVDGVARHELLADGGMLIVEHHRMEQPDPGSYWRIGRQGVYGDSLVTIMVKAGAPAAES